jgi:hypothetical protein
MRSRLREAVTLLERVRIEKFQAAVNDEGGVIQARNMAYKTGSVRQFVGSWENDSCV